MNRNVLNVYAPPKAGGNNNGSGGYLDVGTDFSVTSSGLSVATWVKFDATGLWSRIIDFGQPGGGNGEILFARDGVSNTLSADVYDPNTGARHRVTTPVLHQLDVAGGTNSWVHVAMTLEKPAGGGTKTTLYVNGVQSATGTSTSVNFDGHNRPNNYIGRSNWASDDGFVGSFGDTVIANKVMTATEVANLHSDSNITVDDAANAISSIPTSEVRSFSTSMDLRGANSIVDNASDNQSESYVLRGDGWIYLTKETQYEFFAAADGAFSVNIDGEDIIKERFGSSSTTYTSSAVSNNLAPTIGSRNFAITLTDNSNSIRYYGN